MSKLVNGKKYGWSVIDIKFPFGTVEAQSIDYGDELEKEATYGRGNMPRGYGVGNYKATCKLNFLLDDYEEIENYCKAQGKSLYGLLIPKIVVAYANEGGRPRVDEITNVGLYQGGQQGGTGRQNARR